MNSFWEHNNVTGDNTRERPYANLYQKFTTRSNTFRVHFRVQVLKKARSVLPNQVDESKDTVTAEYRGAALFERYLDFSSTATSSTNAKTRLPDYARVAASGSPFSEPSLETKFHYRVLEMKQFAP